MCVFGVLMCFSLVLFNFHPVFPDCSPVEEGGTAELTCTVNVGASCVVEGTIFQWALSSFPSFSLSCTKTTCGTIDNIDTTIVSSGTNTYTSTMTVTYVTRVDGTWTCEPAVGCGDNVIACEQLQVYALPTDPSCDASEISTSDDEVTAVRVDCQTIKIYPAADCIFYISTDGSSAEARSGIVQSTSTESPQSSDHFYSQCEYEIPVVALGEGTHTFQGRIFPRLDGGGGEYLDGVVNTAASIIVVLAWPEASHQCSTQQQDGYFKGRTATCTCTLSSEGRPKGTAQWYREGVEITQGSDGTIIINYDSLNPEDTYDCKGKSTMGASEGTSLVPKFAFFDEDSVSVTASKTTSNLCGNSGDPATVICSVPKDNINPAPLLSFSLDDITLAGPIEGEASSTGYDLVYTLNPEQGGVYKLMCRAENSVYSDLRQEKSSDSITINEPPSEAPEVTISDQIYRGTDPGNQATLTEGFTGDVTCLIKGGYPDVYGTRLTCGSRDIAGAGNWATLSFQADPLTKEMNGDMCICTAQHISGCYDMETTFTLDEQYKPSLTLTPASAAELDEGDPLTIECDGEGNPPATLRLARERTGEDVASATVIYSETTSLVYNILSADCLDTDTYVCYGSNTVGTVTQQMAVYVRCPQHPVSSTENVIIDAVIGEQLQVILIIFGYPEPTSTKLTTANGVDLSSSDRHFVTYTPAQPPYGSLVVTMTDVRPEDITDYTISVDNGVGVLLYTFSLNQVNTADLDLDASTDNRSSINSQVLGVGLSSLIIIIVLVVVVVLMCREVKRLRQALVHSDTYGPNNGYVDQPDNHNGNMGEYATTSDMELDLVTSKPQQPTTSHIHYETIPESRGSTLNLSHNSTVNASKKPPSNASGLSQPGEESARYVYPEDDHMATNNRDRVNTPSSYEKGVFVTEESGPSSGQAPNASVTVTPKSVTSTACAAQTEEYVQPLSLQQTLGHGEYVNSDDAF